jgi:hypothetical protein
MRLQRGAVIAAAVLATGAVAGLAGCTVQNMPNVAQDRAGEIIGGLAPVHPVLVCDNGDNGEGLDNTIPWYSAYLSAESTAVDDVVITAASHAGWRLSQDEGAPPGVPYQETTTYLADRRNGWTVQVGVVRSGPVANYCRQVDGRPAPDPGKVLIVLSVVAPEVAR